VMTITNAAAEIIRRWLRGSSDLSYPVIYLVQASDTPPEVSKALERGISRKQLQEITHTAMKTVPRYVCPAVYPGSHFIWLTTTINGFRFASRFFYPPHVRRAMKNGVLDAAERGLVLKDADGEVVLPADAGTEASTEGNRKGHER
jgi:hypothetical protein